ncbi:YicC family protein [Vicingus serpentipes]|uniref:YicC family protein n=1 Tax=Vicingus serpentipes TaxID=1926625 RepID=A0A5C6RQZ0_9FLAO|nr:YicC/YloC family endoribonuclease [Vicingus serpentipes]TXB64607.1 YicC family protein [Vicingus serpentipes]
MIKSMTGFGKATAEVNNKKISVEIKSLNSKQADMFVRMPSFYKEKELPVRSLINKELERGKIEFNLYVELLAEQSSVNLNKDLFKKYYTELKDVLADLNEATTNENLVSIVAKMPDVYKSEKSELDETEWVEIEKTIKEAIIALDNFRRDEGKSLLEELTLRINNIVSLLAEVEQYDEERITTVKERISNHLKEAVGEQNINNDRFEQELIFYIEKFDVTEEKTRLTTHCNYFLETLNSDISEGKKLGFISQEIGREINTLGSKANHADIQKIVVKMKDELEKIKEQALNIL